MKEIPINTVVNTSTEEEIREFCNFINNNYSNRYHKVSSCYYVYKDKLCYKLGESKTITHCSIDWYVAKNYNILSFKEFKKKYMETLNEIRIEIPEGMEIDTELSTFECIKFKPKKLTYNDVAKELFKDKYPYSFGDEGNITSYFEPCKNYDKVNLCISGKQAEKILALNKLINVAKYLNRDWKPVEGGVILYIQEDVIKMDYTYNVNYGTLLFKDKETAVQAIEILGEETIKLALSYV